MSRLGCPVTLWNPEGLFLFSNNENIILQDFPNEQLDQRERWFQPNNRKPRNKFTESRSFIISLVWLDLLPSFGFAAGDVYWPGNQRDLEVAPPLLPSCRETREESDGWIWDAVHPRHGSHGHLLHPPYLYHGQVPGETVTLLLHRLTPEGARRGFASGLQGKEGFFFRGLAFFFFSEGQWNLWSKDGGTLIEQWWFLY